MVRERTYCADCQSFKPEDPNGRCKKYGWAIIMKLAESDKICSYESFKDTFLDESSEFVEVRTPLGDVSYVTQETFEKGAEQKGGKLNFWRIPKKPHA